MKALEGQADIYISLDELLDTRRGTLELMDPALNEQIDEEAYQKRASDVFPGVNRTDFRERYKNRDGDTLMVSVMTNAIKLLRKLVATAAEQMDSRPYYSQCSIVVNCHPYNLHQAVVDALHQALQVRIGVDLPIKMVNWPISVLTPEKCKKEFGILIMYNPEEWFNTHMPALERNPMPEVIMLAPMIHHVLEPNDKELGQLKAAGAAPFLAFEMMARPLVSLDMIEVEFFSILNANGI